MINNYPLPLTVCYSQWLTVQELALRQQCLQVTLMCIQPANRALCWRWIFGELAALHPLALLINLFYL
jgi:hypothetical protein